MGAPSTWASDSSGRVVSLALNYCWARLKLRAFFVKGDVVDGSSFFSKLGRRVGAVTFPVAFLVFKTRALDPTCDRGSVAVSARIAHPVSRNQPKRIFLVFTFCVLRGRGTRELVYAAEAGLPAWSWNGVGASPTAGQGFR